MGFVQVRLEVVAIVINNIAAFVRAGQTSLNISSYNLSLSKAKQRFRAEGIRIPHLPQSPNVACKLMTAHYFKRHWDETTGEAKTDSWGLSTYYFETDEKFYVSRQMQLFDNGKILKYDTEYVDDKFGGLSEIPLDMDEFAEYKITKDEFEQLWQTSHYKKFPEIVCTHDTLWGQPRLDERRLAVGDIVSLVDTYHKDITVVLTDFELTLQQVRQTLHYCKALECKKDNPEKFCHNCLLRIEQFNEAIDKDNPEQSNWLKADILFKQHFQAAS